MGRLDVEASLVSLRALLEFPAAARRAGVDFDRGRWLVRPYTVDPIVANV